MDKMSGLSLDLEKENIEKLKELFPAALEEGKINFDMLRSLLGDEVDDSREKYQFTWNGKAKSIKLAQTPSSATLRPCREKSKNWDTTENLYIEGDNLEVLKQLQKTYYGKIKMIYIDPPYNTGNDFVYHDDFKNSIENYKEQTNQLSSSNPESSGRFHTDWLNMMYPRLSLAKNLLCEEGAIFISIDDNEVTNLRRLCDEIFGEMNFLAQISVIVKTEGRQYGFFAKTHEYLLVYAKNKNYVDLNKIKVKDAGFKYFDNDGGFNLIGLRNRAVRIFNSKNRPNLRYPFYVNTNEQDEYGFFKVSTNHTEGWEEIWPSIIDGLESVWRWGKDTAQNKIDELVALRGKDGEIRVFKKDRELTTLPKTVWNDKDFNSIVGTRETASIVGKSIFDFPKPLALVDKIVEIGTNEESIILDFFSGSATTAHALMRLNAEDGGNRKFIMVQFPEKCDEKSEAYKSGYKNICEIGEERIRRAGDQIKTDWEKKHPSDTLFSSDEEFTTDIGFKVFKLDSSNVNEWDSSLELDEKELAERLGEVFKSDRSKKDILYEIMLKYGVFDRQVEEIDVNGKTMYRVGKRYMIVCLEDNVDSNDIKAIGELSPKTVIFKESGFIDDNAKLNAVYNLEKAGVEDIKCI